MMKYRGHLIKYIYIVLVNTIYDVTLSSFTKDVLKLKLIITGNDTYNLIYFLVQFTLLRNNYVKCIDKLIQS